MRMTSANGNPMRSVLNGSLCKFLAFLVACTGVLAADFSEVALASPIRTVLRMDSRANAPRSAALSLRATNGFHVVIFGDNGTATLSATNPHEAATYLTRDGSLKGSGLKVSFGSLGSVSATFHQHGHSQVTCIGGRAQMLRPGVFRGAIRFTGEEGFTRFNRSAVRGVVSSALGRSCRSKEGSKRPYVFSSAAPKAKSLFEVGVQGNSTVLFRAGRQAFSKLVGGFLLDLADLSGPGVPFSASMNEEEGGMSILRVVAAKGSREGFRVDFGGESPQLTVAPPAPFSGSAIYGGRCPQPPDGLRGDLALSFPGHANVPLARKNFVLDVQPRLSCALSD
jgi:hypothetical protein